VFPDAELSRAVHARVLAAKEMAMNARGIPLILTVVNLVLLSMLLMRGPKAASLNELPILRGRGLEIVDDQGRVRASINVYPRNPKFRSTDGRPYPETVLLRLIDSSGSPHVKLSSSDDGAALGLGGVSNPTYIQIIAARDETFLNMTNRDGKKQALKPGRRDGPPPYFPSR
jgi:hypothetical protein